MAQTQSQTQETVLSQISVLFYVRELRDKYDRLLDIKVKISEPEAQNIETKFYINDDTELKDLLKRLLEIQELRSKMILYETDKSLQKEALIIIARILGYFI